MASKIFFVMLLAMFNILIVFTDFHLVESIESQQVDNINRDKMLDIQLYTKCINFAAIKHRDQRRLDTEATPYINHPIGS